MNRPARASLLTAPLVAATALATWSVTDEGRVDAYGVGIVAVGLANAATLAAMGAAEAGWRRALVAVAAVASMPLWAGFATGFALAALHPRVRLGEVWPPAPWPLYWLGGGLRGLMGGIVLWPGLALAAAVVLWATVEVERVLRARDDARAVTEAE